MKAQPEPVQDISGARVLLKLGDSVTTDHISPAGSFKSDTPPASTYWPTVWSARTSIPTAHAVATTKS
ncbi:aconitate hydratase [Arthrobacter sp. Hiyo4]|nr:aconitate hydratase [Arthrobacter sp. Hiyo4]